MKSITIGGTIGRDAVLRRTQNGDAVTGFSVAVDDGFGQNKTTMWFDCSIWGKRGDALVSYLKKGTKVCLSGELGARQHEGKTYMTVNVQGVTLMGGGKPNADGERERSVQETIDDEIPWS